MYICLFVRFCSKFVADRWRYSQFIIKKSYFSSDFATIENIQFNKFELIYIYRWKVRWTWDFFPPFLPAKIRKLRSFWNKWIFHKISSSIKKCKKFIPLMIWKTALTYKVCSVFWHQEFIACFNKTIRKTNSPVPHISEKNYLVKNFIAKIQKNLFSNICIDMYILITLHYTHNCNSLKLRKNLVSFVGKLCSAFQDLKSNSHENQLYENGTFFIRPRRVNSAAFLKSI